MNARQGIKPSLNNEVINWNFSEKPITTIIFQMKTVFYFLYLAWFLFISINTNAQSQTVGLFTHLSGSEDDGYVLFAPVDGSDTTYLIDKCGRLVHQWAADYTPGLDVYLLEDGTLLRSGNYPNTVFDPSTVSAGGIIERYDWNSHLLWHYRISDSLQTQDHDICYLPDGNILVAIWEVISDSVAIANGHNPATLGPSVWSAKVIEIQPVGTDSANIVWQWRVWDHLIQDYDSTKPNYGVVADHPELLNLNYVDYSYTSTTSDWLHLNAVTYNPTLDQVMISTHNLSEIWIIDHSTDSTAAASHTGGVHNKGGDFLYRWGNPAVYNRGTSADEKLFQQHDPTWLTEGKYVNQIMIFNNGDGRPAGNFSSVDIINPPVDSTGNYTLDSGAAYGPDMVSWTYQNPIPGDFFSTYMGGAQLLPNGNILVCEAMEGKFFEIDSLKNIVWDYVNPVIGGVPVAQGSSIPYPYNSVYRCTFYPFTYPGFSGQSVPPGVAPIELNPLSNSCSLAALSVKEVTENNSVDIFPNPASDLITVNAANIKSIAVMNITGQILINNKYTNVASTDVNTAFLPDGVYIFCINETQYKRVVIQH